MCFLPTMIFEQKNNKWMGAPNYFSFLFGNFLPPKNPPKLPSLKLAFSHLKNGWLEYDRSFFGGQVRPIFRAYNSLAALRSRVIGFHPFIMGNGWVGPFFSLDLCAAKLKMTSSDCVFVFLLFLGGIDDIPSLFHSGTKLVFGSVYENYSPWKKVTWSAPEKWDGWNTGAFWLGFRECLWNPMAIWMDLCRQRVGASPRVAAGATVLEGSGLGGWDPRT